MYAGSFNITIPKNDNQCNFDINQHIKYIYNNINLYNKIPNEKELE